MNSSTYNCTNKLVLENYDVMIMLIMRIMSTMMIMIIVWTYILFRLEKRVKDDKIHTVKLELNLV